MDCLVTWNSTHFFIRAKPINKKDVKSKKLKEALFQNTMKVGVKSTSVVGKQVAKTTSKKVPLLGFFVGIGCGAARIFKEPTNWKSYGMASLEVASGALSTFPGAGTISSFATDALIVTLDVTDAATQEDENKRPNIGIYNLVCHGGSTNRPSFVVPLNMQIWFFTSHGDVLSSTYYMEEIFPGLPTFASPDRIENIYYSFSKDKHKNVEVLNGGDTCYDYILQEFTDKELNEFVLQRTEPMDKFLKLVCASVRVGSLRFHGLSKVYPNFIHYGFWKNSFEKFQFFSQVVSLVQTESINDDFIFLFACICRQ